MPSPHPKSPGDLSPSLEHYLRAIYDLQAEKGYARVTDISGILGVAKPAVSSALKNLRATGLVDHRIYESVLLTEEGMKRAKSVSGKYAILLDFLIEVLGVDKEQAFVDACLMEHYVSGTSSDRLIDLLRFFEDKENKDVLEAFHAFRRSCESETNCPECSFHCDVSLQGPDIRKGK
jgi:DtxR family Mn-dependent transcriptional regulator